MKVFIQTNHKQILGAYVAAYLLKRNSANPEAFEVELMELKDLPALHGRSGQHYRRNGVDVAWDNEDLQSFTLTRFLPPELMGYQGRAVVIDPEVFALGDVNELLAMDMQGKAIRCRHIAAHKQQPDHWATSVMLLDNAKLTHWRWQENLDELFSGKRDYRDWMSLLLEDQSTIGDLDEVWNSLDKLTPETRMLHTTKRLTQPWKTGLPVDFSRIDKPPRLWKKARKRHLVPSADSWIGNKIREGFRRGEHRLIPRTYQPNSDPRQVEFFFESVAECLEKGVFDEALVKREIAAGHVRKDALEVVAGYRSRVA